MIVEKETSMKRSSFLSVFILGFAGALAAVPAMAATVLYSNGPTNDSIDAINFTNFPVTDSFVLSRSSTVTGVSFDAWLYPGDTMSQVDWSIGTSAFDSSLGSGTAATTGVFKETGLFTYEIYTESISGLDLPLGAGTYWLTFRNATTTNGDAAFWDENNGPSTAFFQIPGLAITSETFQILGESESPIPEPSSFLLLGSGLVGLAGLIKRKLAA